MALEINEIASEGIEDKWIAFAKGHWEEHVPENMHSWFDVDIATIQRMEEVGGLVGYVATDGGATVGYALVSRGGGLFSKTTLEWTVLCIYTHPGARRSGVFDGIMRLLEREALDDGAVMFNMMAPAEFKAHNYMREQGFTPREVTYRKQLR